jgi:hypothetical protein
MPGASLFNEKETTANYMAFFADKGSSSKSQSSHETIEEELIDELVVLTEVSVLN